MVLTAVGRRRREERARRRRLTTQGRTDGVQCSAATNSSTARSPGPPSDHVVFSKDEEGGFPVPFPRRRALADEHSSGAKACKFRSLLLCWVQEKVQKLSENEGEPGRKKEKEAAAAEGKERGARARVVEGIK